MRKNENGFGLVLVLILLALGSLLIAPVLRLTSTTLKAKQINSELLNDQYARDGCTELGLWQLIYGDSTQTLTESNDEEQYSCTLNNIDADVTLRMRTNLGNSAIPGAEDNRVQPGKSVVCAEDGVNFNDDCLDLPSGLDGMVAKYTITLEQISPDVSVGLTHIYDQLPTGFSYRPGTVTTLDDSLLEIVGVIPENIGSPTNQIMKWTLSSPVYFEQTEEKVFTFEADINKSAGRYCNDLFLNLEEDPNEKTGKTAIILVDRASAPLGCNGAGMQVEKFVDNRVSPPGMTTRFTYIINVHNLENNTLFVENVKDVLPQGTSWGSVFQFCDPDSLPPDNPDPITCDLPMYKVTDVPFDPDTGDFNDTTGFLDLEDPQIAAHATDMRWELVWNFVSSAGPCALPSGCSGAGLQIGQSGSAGDVLIIRFQAHVTPEASGSYYNEAFVSTDCTAPSPLRSDADLQLTDVEYCSSYSWPTGGTLVPMYDVNSEADRTSGQANVTINANETILESWHVDDL